MATHIHLVQKEKESIFLEINCQNNWFRIHKFKAMLLRPEKMKRNIYLNLFTHP